jgi:hypothetical protein
MDIIATPRKSRGGKSSKKGRQASHSTATGKYTRQRLRTERNKARSRQKHLELNPNDLQAQARLG